MPSSVNGRSKKNGGSQNRKVDKSGVTRPKRLKAQTTLAFYFYAAFYVDVGEAFF